MLDPRAAGWASHHFIKKRPRSRGPECYVRETSALNLYFPPTLMPLEDSFQRSQVRVKVEGLWVGHYFSVGIFRTLRKGITPNR